MEAEGLKKLSASGGRQGKKNLFVLEKGTFTYLKSSA